jgi:hypothetical protein
VAEITELFERVRRGGDGVGLEEFVTAMSLMQGQLDLNSFMAGMLAGRSFHRGSRWQTMLLPLMMSSMNANAAGQQAIGTPSTSNPMQQLWPLMLLMGGGDGDWREREEKVETVVERGSPRSTK